MPLGYALKTGDVLAYYGLERKDIAQTLFEYGKDRRVVMTNDPNVLGGSRGQRGFQTPDDILMLVQKALDGNISGIPKKYPSFHSTIGRYGGFAGRAQKGADIVIDIDVKDNYKEAFRNGKKVIQFLDFYNIPYRIKFSGGTGPHIIIPYEAFPEAILEGKFNEIYQKLFHIITSRSKAGHIDSSFTSTNHFYRMPYSLNENTGLVSLPIRREQYDDFTPAVAEIWNVEIDEEWFAEPEKSAKEAIIEMLRDNEKKR